MKQRAAARWITITSIGLLCFGLLSFHVAQAASLDFAADYLNRQQADLSSGLSHTIFFTPATTLPIAGNNVRLTFSVSPAGTWCRVAGADLSVSGVSDPGGASEGATPLPGLLSAACTQGNGSSTFDTITVTNVGSLTAGVKYGLSISEVGVAKLGTPPAAIGISQILTTNNGSADVDSLLFFANTLSSDRVSVAATVVGSPPTNPNPSVEFRGVGAPSGTVTVLRDSTHISSVPTPTDATFDVALNDQPSGQHVYTIQGLDRDGHALTPMTFALQLSSGSTTIINGIFLGPSINIDKQAVKLGQFVNIFGNTAPQSSVSVTVNSTQALSYTVTANSSGFWSKIINTQEVGVGTHTARARSFLGGSTISEFSSMVSFAVNPLEQCDGKVSADLNCDGKVNLTDFSIILFFWQVTGPSNSRADMNGDGRVDVVDFSIMLFLWTA